VGHCCWFRVSAKSRGLAAYATLPLIALFPLTLREERRLKVFENRVLRRVFGPRRDEVTGEWRKLHNEELNDLYSLPNIVRVVK
jgi:hypothetical protein